MRTTENIQARIRARDRGLSLINQLTAGTVIAGVGALAVFGVAGAVTAPGSSSSTTAIASSSTTSTGSASSGGGLQSSSGSISSTSSGSGVVVSGGS